MSLLSDQELVDLKTDDEVFLLLVYVDHDGSRHVWHAGRTTMRVEGSAGQRWYYSPECDEQGVCWFEDQMNADCFMDTDVQPRFFSDAEECREAFEAETAPQPGADASDISFCP